MFSNLTIGILLGIGFGGWVYSKMIRSTGGNTQNAVIIAVISGLGALALVTTILGMIF